MATRSTVALFWSRVDRSAGDDGCWLWTGGRNSFGYGRLRWGADTCFQRRGTHRISWELANGQIPTGMVICHRCDNPPCVNPAHLFLGTDADNRHDMIAKGRNSWAPHAGTDNPNVLLTPEQVLTIRGAWNSGAVSQQRLADAFGLSQTGISSIVRRITWRHI